MKFILLVDDDSENVRTTKELLEHLGYNVKTATSGSQALTFLRKTKEKVDLVLLDILMPNMGGDKVAQEIRKATKLKDLKIAFLSVVELGDQGKRLVTEFNAVDYIAKPVNPSELKRKLARILK